MISLSVVKATKKAVYPGLTYDNWISVAYVVVSFIVAATSFIFGRMITSKCKIKKINRKRRETTMYVTTDT